MAENENAAPDAAGTESQTVGAEGQTGGTEGQADGAATAPQQEAPAEEITYHAVEKDGQVTAIWEMQGRKHVRTIDPRSRQGQEILRLYTAEHGE